MENITTADLKAAEHWQGLRGLVSAPGCADGEIMLEEMLAADKARLRLEPRPVSLVVVDQEEIVHPLLTVGIRAVWGSSAALRKAVANQDHVLLATETPSLFSLLRECRVKSVSWLHPAATARWGSILNMLGLPPLPNDRDGNHQLNVHLRLSTLMATPDLAILLLCNGKLTDIREMPEP